MLNLELQAQKVVEKFKAAGYNRCDKHTHSNDCIDNDCIDIYAYDTKRGVRISARVQSNTTNVSATIACRKSKGYSHVCCSNDVDNAILLAKDLKGKQSGKAKIDINDRMVWRTALLPDKTISSGIVTRRVNIVSAECLGLCTIDKSASCTLKDLDYPEVEGYFLTKCYDYRNRELYLIMQSDADSFLVGLRRGKRVSDGIGEPLIKVVADDCLFKNGNPLDVRNFALGDIVVVTEAIELWLKS